jgi:hypothetical protein
MNAPVPARRPDGTLLPGQRAINPGGRPRSVIEQVRGELLPNLPKYLRKLDELASSNNEDTRLRAIREILDRILGKPIAMVDATHTRVDVAALYLQALKQVNEKTVTSHVLPSEQELGKKDTGSDCAAVTSGNGTTS